MNEQDELKLGNLIISYCIKVGGITTNNQPKYMIKDMFELMYQLDKYFKKKYGQNTEH